ncbi:ATP-grasp domain-containing protein [Streptomyces sp. 2224.1]|uniref:ATP-grasp domain-containing protein n=1 Tax=unclassified Streptomyces TaxID=2593676 RepID=UPI00088C7F31|nr:MULTISPECIES: ATP-grasp domain-containing protein [unclassified Streptomyces]PBC82474.1 ATP-grasp domain-containing protein [Streptomyces sp. 2321.6]SDR49463.1 ATP-grasp domain-containing protein [Streptomyces sp. KS_16]SEC45150.1 ATP-grasp domain-containing protein [Streptomyces sp. 2224.1]SEC59354.1 ATP-grasp domain-containing protein [Streptomyces sp. 2133.1]SNC68476.1 ATP-grasp domain-containing protein [Streptomyces sp. 2114.4]
MINRIHQRVAAREKSVDRYEAQTPSGEGSASPTGPLAVVFDSGAASAQEIGAAVQKIGPAVLVAAPSAAATAARPLLARAGHLVTLDNGFDHAVREMKAHNIAGIVTFSEDALPLTGALAAALEVPFHDAPTLTKLTEKYPQRMALADAGVSPVRCRRIGDASEWVEAVTAVGLPAVVKPMRGAASRNTFHITDEAQGAALVAQLLDGAEDSLVVEEYLVGQPNGRIGDYVSVECLVIDGVVDVLMISGKFPQLPPFRETGQFWPAHLSDVQADQVRSLAVTAVGAVGIRSGFAHVEVKLTRSGPRIIEVNGRLGGLQAELAQRAAGLDLVELGGRVAVGRPVTVKELELDRVYFQYYCPAPTCPSRLVRVRGLREVAKVPDITAYRAFVGVGTELAGGVATLNLGGVFGEAATFEAMMTAVDRALDLLVFEFETAHGVVGIPARDLGHAHELLSGHRDSGEENRD